MSSGLDAVFHPDRIALVGASDKPGKMGATFMRNLAAFTGEVIPVTVSQRAVDGHEAYRTLREVPGQVDLAVVVVPAETVPEVMSDAAAAGVGAAVIISGGFAEVGESGAALQVAAVRAGRAGGVRLIGPNCFGIQNCNSGLNASMAIGTPMPGGDIALATQSGAYGMAIYMLGLEQNVRFSKVYAAGNKADVTDAEILRYLAEDPESSVLCFFLESIDDGRSFFELARRVTQDKPIILAKTGRTEAGARAAISHTAAMTGKPAVWKAAMDQAGVVLVRSGLEMIDAAKMLDWQPILPGPRVAIVTNSGGTGVELADLLSEEGLLVEELSSSLQERLREKLPRYASVRNPVDITPTWSRFAQLYPLCIEELARSGEVDVVIPMLVQRPAMDPDVAGSIRDVAGRLADLGSTVPICVCWVAPREAQPNADLLQSSRIPCFEWPERTARAVGHAWCRAKTAVRRSPAPSLARGAVRSTHLASGIVPPVLAADLVATYGIAVVPQVVCRNEREGVAAAKGLGYPVVVKLMSERVPHKSEAGAVRTGLPDERAVQGAVRDLHALDPNALLLVQAHVAGVEVIVGGFQDDQFGPVVAVGMGGAFVEVLRDVALRIAPIDEPEAREAIRSLRGFPILAGARNRQAISLDAIASTLAGASRLLADAPQVVELDLNPVIATPQGAVAVDVRMVAGSSGGR